MTELLDQAFAAARHLPAETRDSIARVVLRLAGMDDTAPPVVLSTAERVAIATSKAAAAQGDFATEDEVRAVWSEYGL